MSKLFELTAQYNLLQSLVEDETADKQCLLDTLESIQGEIEDKTVNIAKLIKSIDADIEAIKAEEERLTNRRKAYENRKESIKEYLEQQLITTGIDKVKTPTMTVALQNNAPSIKVIDEAIFNGYAYSHYAVPQPPKIDRKSIL